MSIRKNNKIDNNPPTFAQWKTLEYIGKYLEIMGYAPSIPDIAYHFKISWSSAWERVERLKRKGFIYKKDYQRRGIDLPDNWDKRIEIKQFFDFKGR